MLVYITKRCLQIIPVMLGITLTTFILMNVMAGDPVMQLMDSRSIGMDASTMASIRHQWGLDKPLSVQYGLFLRNALHGDLGRSYASREPVARAIAERFPNSLRLGVAALLYAVLVGVAAGTVAAARRNSWFDAGSMVVALAGISMPVFWLGLLIMYLFAVQWRVLPASGIGRGEIKYLVMPAFTLGSAMTAVIARVTRSAMLNVVRADYITTVRAKGLPEATVILRHVLRNALIPVITIIGVEMGNVLSGAVITETVFNWPGVGRLIVDSINKRDLPMVQGIVVFLALLFAVVNLLVDVAYAGADPHIRYA